MGDAMHGQGKCIMQQAHVGQPYNTAAAGFLIIKLNYCELSDNFKIHRINMKMFWQRFHQFSSPFPRWSRLKIQIHPQNRGKFPNSGSPCTLWMSAQA